MGNHFACMCDVFHFALVENLILESKHRKNILLLVRFTCDVLIIWKKVKKEPNDWKEFERCLNNVSNLNWVCEDLVEKVVFLDLEILIDRREKKFTHKPHTKEMSLILHFLPHSARPKEAWKGMIRSLLSKNWRHCCR